MALVDDLKIKVQELVAFELNKGVTPIELATNIYEEDYTEVKIKKQFGHINCSVQFYDSEFFHGQKIKFEYRYIYDVNNYLQEIHHVKNKSMEILWSRSEERTKILSDICEIASNTDKLRLKNLPFDKIPEQVRMHLKAILEA